MADWGPDSSDYFLDLSDLSRHPFEAYYAWRAVVSPRQTQLAYLNEANAQVVVQDAAGNTITQLPAAEGWHRVAGWLDEDRLLIETLRFVPFEEPYKLPSLVILDLSSGSSHEYFPEDYPNHYDQYETFFDFRSVSRLVVDPAQSLMVYPAYGGAEIPLILWNLADGNELARIHRQSVWFGYTPLWSPDGAEFVVSAPIRLELDGVGVVENIPGEPFVGGNELLGMSRNGEMRRLTYVTSTFAAAASSPAWSRDGRFIAFWLNIFDSEMPGERLAVADTLTGEVTNYCLPGFMELRDGQSSRPIWSPDGAFLAVTIPNSQDIHNGWLVDLEAGYAVQLAENASVIGWLAKAP